MWSRHVVVEFKEIYLLRLDALIYAEELVLHYNLVLLPLYFSPTIFRGETVCFLLYYTVADETFNTIYFTVHNVDI